MFAGLRRRRWALCLTFGYALLVNAVLAPKVDGAAAAVSAVSADAVLAVVDAALCNASGAGPAGHPDGGAEHQHHQECPLCGPACHMGGCTATGGPAGAIALASRPSAGTLARPLVLAERQYPPSVYRSDADSQAPPAA
jgi:hypothetical protein